MLLKLKPSFGRFHLQHLFFASRVMISTTTTVNPESTTTTDNPKSPTTIDPSDLETFSNVASIWWNKKGLMKGLHSLNKMRVPFILEALASQEEKANLQNKKVLDVGCGGGILSEALAKYGITVTGIDATIDVIDVAVQHSKNNSKISIKPSYYCTSIEEHSNDRKNYYDGVVASEVIEHVNNKELFVKSCVKALRPEGTIVFTTPTRTRLSQLVNIWLGENVLGMLPKGTHQYEKLMTPDELKLLLESNGCHVEATRGLMCNMINSTWSWTDTKDLFFAVRAVKTIKYIHSVKIPKMRQLSTSNCYCNEKHNTQSTVDAKEIQLFSTMKDWWNPQGPMKPLHSMNAIRVPLVRDGIMEYSEQAKTLKPLKNKKILDVGCGGGILSEVKSTTKSETFTSDHDCVDRAWVIKTRRRVFLEGPYLVIEHGVVKGLNYLLKNGIDLTLYI